MIFNPHEKRVPSSVKQSVCPSPPSTFKAFFSMLSLSSFTFMGKGYFVFFPFPVCPNLASPQQYRFPYVSIAIEWDAPQAI